MPQFATPSLSVEVPAGWNDRSTYILAGAPVAGFTPTLSITVNHRVLDAYLERHVLIQTQEMEKKLPGFRLLHRVPAYNTPQGQVARLEFEWQSAEAGQWLHQSQMYVLAGSTLYILTATAPLTFFGELQPTFERMLESFQPAAPAEPWP